MPHLDQRLQVVARQIRWHTHADIGSDHAHLLKALLKSGRIAHGIAIENKSSPCENSRRTLAGLSAQVRLADGLEGLAENEADGLSVCGMGGVAIARILQGHPQRVPSTIVLQPNCQAEVVRRWALNHRYDLVDETLVVGSGKRGKASKLATHRRFVVLRFERSSMDTAAQGPHHDVAYTGLDHEAAILFGPRLIRAWTPDFAASLHEEQTHLGSLDRLGPESTRRLAAIERLVGTTGLPAINRVTKPGVNSPEARTNACTVHHR